VKTIHIPRRFVSEEWGGTETTILQLCRSMNAKGHDANIFTSLALSNKKTESIQGVKVRRFPYCYPFFGLSDDNILSMDKKGGNMLSLSMLWALLQTRDVDVFHAHTGKRTGGIVRTAARIRKIPYVITLHGGVFDVPEGEMKQMLEPISNRFEWGKPFGALLGSRQVLQDAAAVICVGENECLAAQKAMPNQRVEFLPNGVDGAFFAEGDGSSFRMKHGIAQACKLILCLSRIDYQKNQIGLVESLPAILNEQPDAHLLLIGPVTVASYHKKICERIAQLGIKQHVTLLPGLKPDDQALADAYHAADVFCLPSLHEPFGIVILEAWAAGLPVVASKVGGIPSFTTDGENILHVDLEQKFALAAALIRLLADSDLAKRLASQGYAKARQEYDWETISERLLGIYNDLRHK